MAGGDALFARRDRTEHFRTHWIPAVAENGVAFDYAVPRDSLGVLAEGIAFDAMAKRVAAAGEPFVGFFETDDLIRELRRGNFPPYRGFRRAEEINARYFQNRGDGLRIGGMAHLMCAHG